MVGKFKIIVLKCCSFPDGRLESSQVEDERNAEPRVVFRRIFIT